MCSPRGIAAAVWRARVAAIIAALALSAGCGNDPIGPVSARPQVTSVEDLARNRTSHTATLIADTASQQSILFVGGGGGSCSRELYMVGRGSTLLEFEGACRIDHTATALDDGSVLIVGGQDSLKIASETLASAEIYSPTTEGFSAAGNLGTARYGHDAILLEEGTALITGGYMTNYLLHKVQTASAEIYDPALGAFSQLPDMNYPRADHTTTLLEDGSVLIVGGTTEPAPMEKYIPQEKRFQVIPDTEFARSNHSATLLEDGSVLIAGGIDLNGTTLAHATLFDPESASFSATGLMKIGRAGHTASQLPDGSVALTGGNGADHWALSSVEIYDPLFREFSIISHMLRPRVGHTATYVESLDGILVAGGWGPLHVTGPVIMRDVDLLSVKASR